MRFDKVLLILNVQLKPESLQQYLPCSANIIGQTLAAIADEYEKENRTGYYPAMDFFKTLETVDPDLIASAEQVSWLVSKLARETIQSKLRPIFSSVQFQSIQTLAFSLPKVRPNRADAIEQLAKHYTPDTVKIELLVTMMRRDSEAEDSRAEPYARKMVFRWLDAEFESVEVTNSKAL
jgi:post-segregation antitoxin (ccd killing protein)